jgi:hypothetical protein
MKKLKLLFLFISLAALGQDNDSNVWSGFDTNGFSGVFYNRVTPVEGTTYLFDNWEQNAIVHKILKDKFLVRRVNLNLNKMTFDAKITESEDVLSFSFDGIDKIEINKRIYKNILYNNSKILFELLYDTDKIKFMKGFEVKLIKASKDPMVNRPFDKYVKSESYYLMNEEIITKIKLKKKIIYNTLKLNKTEISNLDSFIKSTSISLKKEQDIIKLLMYLNSN